MYGAFGVKMIVESGPIPLRARTPDFVRILSRIQNGAVRRVLVSKTRTSLLRFILPTITGQHQGGLRADFLKPDQAIVNMECGRSLAI